MNIYIIINSLSKGGAERIASDYAHFLAEKNIKTTFLITDRSPIEYKLPLTSEVNFLPLSKYSRTFFFPLIVILQGLFIRIKYGGSIKAISFLHRANLVNGVAKIFSSRKLIISERSIFNRSYSGLKKIIMNFLLGLLFKKVSKIIAISSVVKKELIEEFSIKEEKIEVIYNPINSDNFTFSKSKKTFLSDTTIHFCIVGRLVESKRVQMGIILFLEVLEIFPDSRLSIVGDGPEAENLKTFVLKNENADKITFLGQINDVHNVLKKSDMLIFTSRYESFGNVAIEATSVGLPIIYTQNLESLNEIYFGTTFLALSLNEDILTWQEEIKKFMDHLEYESFRMERENLLIKIDRENIFNRYLKYCS